MPGKISKDECVTYRKETWHLSKEIPLVVKLLYIDFLREAYVFFIFTYLPNVLNKKTVIIPSL